MNSMLSFHDSNPDKVGVVSDDDDDDDEWEEVWNEGDHEDTMMHVLFSDDTLNSNRQSNWTYDHIVWGDYV